jgi:hypothetical protein
MTLTKTKVEKPKRTAMLRRGGQYDESFVGQLKPAKKQKRRRSHD